MQEAAEINRYSEIKSIQQSGYINCLSDKLLSLSEMNCKRAETNPSLSLFENINFLLITCLIRNCICNGGERIEACKRLNFKKIKKRFLSPDKPHTTS